MIGLTRENNWLPASIPYGWGNGYVIIPKGHSLYGIDYEDIDVNIHGGLTYGSSISESQQLDIPKEVEDGWVVGFDTLHYLDTQSIWTKAAVEAEVENLKQQLLHYGE